jgi:hypothetical protein
VYEEVATPSRQGHEGWQPNSARPLSTWTHLPLMTRMFRHQIVIRVHLHSTEAKWVPKVPVRQRGVQGPVGLAVPTAIEAMTDLLTR